MTSLLQHTKSELRAAGLFDDANFQGDAGIHPQLAVALMETLVAYDPSETSRVETLEAFARLAQHLPLSPLTGEDDEWEIPKGMGGQMMINKRCTRVFKDDEMAWDVQKGRTPITFPYLPE